MNQGPLTCDAGNKPQKNAFTATADTQSARPPGDKYWICSIIRISSLHLSSGRKSETDGGRLKLWMQAVRKIDQVK